MDMALTERSFADTARRGGSWAHPAYLSESRKGCQQSGRRTGRDNSRACSTSNLWSALTTGWSMHDSPCGLVVIQGESMSS